jgi:Zn-dependent protease
VSLPNINDPVFMLRFIGILLGFVVGTTFHEFSHAYSATMLGDDLPGRQGRLTLNPVAHFDPLGFFMMVLLAAGIGFLAWGKPVQVNPYNLRYGRRGMALVAIAGPLSNIVTATVLSLPLRFNVNMPSQLHEILLYMVYVNVLLFAFNLIPLPPLDGYAVLNGLVSNYWNVLLEPIRRYSIPILLALVFLPTFLGNVGLDLNLIGRMIGGPFTLIFSLILPGA